MTEAPQNRTRPIIMTLIIWLIATFVWTPISFNYIDKAIGRMFLALHFASGLGQSVFSFVATNFGEILLPICLYVFVVRRYVPNRVVNTRLPNRYYFWVLTTLIIGLYFYLVPHLTYEYQVSSHLMLGATFIGVGLCEEYAYRGIMIRVFKEWIGLVPAVFLAALLFGLSHWAYLLSHGQLIFSPNWLINIVGNSFFGLVFGIIVWRGGSLLWAVFLHFMNDWRPWNYGNPHWVQSLHVPWLGNNISILVFGLLGAEVLRLFTVRTVQASPQDSGPVVASKDKSISPFRTPTN